MLAATAVLAAAVFAGPAHAGRIVVNSDEWTLSDAGYDAAGMANADRFARNLVGFLDTDGTSGGNVLIYSNNFGLTGSSLSASLAGAGYSVTRDTGLSFDLATLQGYDAIFMAGSGFARDDSVLADYVNGGGGVYIAAGTGTPGSAFAEAALWNGFLAGYGLSLGFPYNGVTGNVSVDPGSHLLFDGVERLYFDNGNSVSADPLAGNAGIRMSNQTGAGLIGTYASDPTQAPPNSVPVPGTLALLGLGLAGLAARSRRR